MTGMSGKPVDMLVILERAGLTQKQRRRGYSVLNVLTGLGCVKRAKCAQYAWLGWKPLLELVERERLAGLSTPPQRHKLRNREWWAKRRTEDLAVDMVRVMAQSGRTLFTMSTLRNLMGMPDGLRTLYDVLNVFCALGMVQKRARQQSFKWSPEKATVDFVVAEPVPGSLQWPLPIPSVTLEDETLSCFPVADEFL